MGTSTHTHTHLGAMLLLCGRSPRKHRRDAENMQTSCSAALHKRALKGGGLRGLTAGSAPHRFLPPQPPAVIFSTVRNVAESSSRRSDV